MTRVRFLPDKETVLFLTPAGLFHHHRAAGVRLATGPAAPKGKMADRPASVSESRTHCKGVCFHILPNFVLEMFCFTWWEEEEEGLGSGEGW